MATDARRPIAQKVTSYLQKNLYCKYSNKSNVNIPQKLKKANETLQFHSWIL